MFNQVDEIKSWYIILKGSVQCVVYGKGVVGTYHEGDDFGKLTLVNHSPRLVQRPSGSDRQRRVECCRTATIVLNEDNTHFLRDVEANTITLKEFGNDVLVLEKVPINVKTFDCCCRYFVMCGTTEKILEYFLETYICVHDEEGDASLDDFFSTYIVFMPANQICARLLSIYKAKTQQRLGETFDLVLREKVKVIRFTRSIGRDVLRRDENHPLSRGTTMTNIHHTPSLVSPRNCTISVDWTRKCIPN